MAKLSFRVEADTSPVKKFRAEIEQVEKAMIRIKGENFSFNHWLREFDRLKSELEKKRVQIDALKKDILNIDLTRNPSSVGVLEKELQKTRKEQDALINETASLSNKFGKAYDELVATLLKAQKVTDGVSAKLIEQKNVISDLQSEVRALNAEYRNANKDDKVSIRSQITVKQKQLEQERITLNGLRAEQERAKLTVKGLSDETRSYEKVVGHVSGAQAEANMVFSRFEKSLFALGSLSILKQLGGDLIRIRGEFQKTQMAFETMLGSKEKADMLMAQMVQTAAKTPFDLQGVANGAKQLLAYGTQAENVNDTLVRLGNIASGLSIPLNDMVYLYGTTQTQGRLFTQDVRQFMGRGIPLVKELATMLGKTEEEINKMVTAGKIGFPEVEKVIKKMTDEGGQFYNLMERQSQTLSGQISNLGDAWDGMLNSVGEKTQDLTSSTISLATTTIENYQKIGEILAGLIMMYGSYKAATIAYYSMSKTYGIYDIATKELQFAATMKNVVATQALAAKQAFLNKVTMLNPYAILAASVVGLVAAMVYMNKETDYAGKAQSKLNDAIKEAEKGALAEQRELAKLKGELSATTKGTEDYNKIRDKIVSNYGKYDKNLKDEIDKVGLLDETYQNLTKSIQQSFNTRQYDKFKQEQGTALDDVMSENLDSMYDKLVGKWGDELGSKYYTEIKNALMAGEEIPKHLNNVVSNMYGVWAQSLHNYINNIREAQKATEDADKKARVKFGVADGGIGNNTDANDGSTEKTKVAIASIADEIDTVTLKVSTLKQELTDLRSGKTSAEAGKTVKEVIEGKVKDLKAAEDALSTLTGKDTATDKKASDEQKKALEARKKLNEELLSLRMQNQQAEINLMAEGREKRLAQIEFDYDSEIAVILAKEKEWKEAQGGKLTEDQTKEVHVSFFNSYVKKEKSSALVDKDQLEAEKQAMNEYLVAYGNYQEKRKAITEKYNDLMAKATTEGEKLSLGKVLTKSLSDLDIEANKTTSAISVLFDDMSKKTVEDLHAIADAGEEALEFLQNGQWDATTGVNLGMSEETFKTLKDSPEQLQAIKDEIANVRKEADKCETSFNKISGGLKKMFSSGGDTKKFQEGLADVSEGMNDVMQAGQFLSDSLTELGNAFGNDTLTGIAEGVNVAMDAMGSAMDGAKAGAAFGPWGAAAGAAIGMVTSLASSFAKIHDAKNEKRIAVLQEQIEVLDKTYDKLGESVEKAYSKDASNLISQQNKLLEQQKVLIQQQIREEEDKKKTDNDRIKEWREQIEDINNAISDNKEAGKDAIFGSDIKSAIDDFAGAYADAWSAGDKAESGKELVKKMIKNMITESIKAAASDPMKEIREKLLEFWADDYISDWEQNYLDQKAQELTDSIDKQFGWADKYFKEDEAPEEDASDNSLKGAYAKASQESITLLAGQAGAQRVIMEDIRNNMIPIREQMLAIREMNSKGWEDVKLIRDLTVKIDKNSEQVAENTRMIHEVASKISENTRDTVDALEGTINVKIKGM